MSESVAPGAETTVVCDVAAPAVPGFCSLRLRLAAPDGSVLVGDALELSLIVVANGASDDAPQPSATPATQATQNDDDNDMH